MPAPITADDFLELVRKSGLVDDARCATYLNGLRAAGSLSHEPPKLAGLFVRDALLTVFQAEQILQGKWRRFSIGMWKVLERIGAGRHASVYLCEFVEIQRLHAVKVLPTAKANDPLSLKRFYQECQILASLSHPNVVAACLVGQDNAINYLGMEYVDGSSLEDIVEKCGPIDVTRTAHYIRQAALGLQHLHERRVVHRDIKPADILVDRRGMVKIIDMGFARIIPDATEMPLGNYHGEVLGTADYMAPEQAVDPRIVDSRADIYSLGATFYYCLVGDTPFGEGTLPQKVIWHQTRKPEPIRQLRPGVPKELEALISRMMAKDPAHRPQTPQEVADSLAPYTVEPIAPPPEEEMPWHSPAVRNILRQ